MLQQHPKAPARIRYPVCWECVKLLSDTAPASANSTGFSKEHVFQPWGAPRGPLCFEGHCHLPRLRPHQGLCSNGSVSSGINSLPRGKSHGTSCGFVSVRFVLLWQNWDGMDGISSLPMGTSGLWLGDEICMNFLSQRQEKCQRELSAPWTILRGLMIPS